MKKSKLTNGTLAHDVALDLAGALGGAAIGAVAGPIGMVAGGILGVVAGATTGAVLDEADEVTRAAGEELDETIGVVGGDLGAASPNAPKARVGAFSTASSGGSAGTGATSDGPIPPPED